MGRDTHRIVARVSDRRVLVLGAASLARNRLRLPTTEFQELPYLHPAPVGLVTPEGR